MSKYSEAYKEIFEILDKHKDICIFDITDLKHEAENHLFGVELKEKYGLNLDPKVINSTDFNYFGDYMSIGNWGEKYGRTLSWSADDRQPQDEILFRLYFSTGPYIFASYLCNKDYPQSFFEKFWIELKSFNPDYIDKANNCLYWNINNAKDVFNCFDEVLRKYYALNKEDIKHRTIAKMKKDLDELENKQ